MLEQLGVPAPRTALLFMNDFFASTWEWIRSDYRAHPVRFVVECVAWAISVGCSICMALTVPNPPLVWLYPAWISGCAMYAWAAYTRQSFGMLANYLLLTSIDLVGLIRLTF